MHLQKLVLSFKVTSTLPRTYLHLLLHKEEDSLYSNAQPHTGHVMALGVKLGYQAIIASTSSHTAHIQSLRCSLTRRR